MSTNHSNSTAAFHPVTPRWPVRIRMERGFSILELMIALFVLLFGFITMANLIATSVVVNRSSNHLTSIAQLASEKLEEIRALDATDPRVYPAILSGSPGAPVTGGSLTGDVTTPVNVGGVNYTISYFDVVYVNQRDGSITRTAGPDDTGNFSSETTSLDGATTPPAASGNEPTQLSYRRRWTIESNTPINGATQITVEVAVKTNKLSDPDPPATLNNFRQVIRMRTIH
ncbi:MAG: hypothetical protein LAO31_04935 [Acidobacteriia bacterium]|nr:hypothetical protein [Terriglobia bacterium]